MQLAAPKALLFDLGGVLVDIDFDRALLAWSACSSLSFETLKRTFCFDEQYERHERGEIEAAQYFAHLAASLRIVGDLKEVAAGWNAIFIGPVATTLSLVANARRSVPCYVLTNTNATHKDRWAALFPDVVAAVDRIFASYEIGHRKPERAAFDHVCLTTGVEPRSILYFDDCPMNVEAGTNAGLHSVLVRSPEDVAKALQAVGM